MPAWNCAHSSVTGETANMDVKGSYTVPNSADVEKGLGAIRRNPRHHEELKPYAYEDAQTLYGAFQRGKKLGPNNPYLGYRKTDADGKAGPYEWLTYSEVETQAEEVGSALIHLDMCPKNEDGLQLVGIFSKNRVEWVVTEEACNCYNMVVVPLYDTLDPNAVGFILQQTKMHTVFCSKTETPELLKTKKEHPEDANSFKHIVQFEDVDADTRKQAEQLGISLRSLAELKEVGRANRKEHNHPKPEDVATFCYTSGTTGNPKGAMLTHGNIIADASSAVFAGITTSTDDVHLSYLPLAHTFEHLVEVFIKLNGGRIGFFQGDVRKLTDDLAALRPTIFPSVPRLYNKFYDKIYGGAMAAGGIKTWLFKKALAAKKHWLKQNYNTHGLWDTLVFNKVRRRLGLDRCRIMLTGSAPIAPHVIEFLRCVFCCAVMEGYGQTECSAAASVSSINDHASLGHVGTPLACNEIRLVSVEEMGYSVTDAVHGRVEKGGKLIKPGIKCDGRGEVCYRGYNIFKGYYHNDEKTAEALDDDGWLHSGDIGMWDENGNLRIIDRKKNIFKLSQGEYVAAEKIENAYARSPLVAQIFVYGDSLQSCLVAIVVPDQEYIEGVFLDTKEGSQFIGKSFEDICADEEFKNVVMASLADVGKQCELRGFEKVKDIYLESTPWQPGELLTPTFKLKRNVAKERYGDAIDKMYASGIGVVAGQSGIRQGETTA